jgi:hypothetical protein
MADGDGVGGGAPVRSLLLDLDSYASRYKGRTRLVRLLFIARGAGWRP